MGYWDAWQGVECIYLDLEDRKGSKFYCTNGEGYVNPSDSSCRKFHCNRIEILDLFRQFKDCYMLNNPEAFAFMNAYNNAEISLVSYIKNDKTQETTFAYVINNFVKPAIACIKNKDYDNAIEFYKDMIDSLMEKYGLDQNILSSSKVIGQNVQRKRELQTV